MFEVILHGRRWKVGQDLARKPAFECLHYITPYLEQPLEIFVLPEKLPLQVAAHLPRNHPINHHIA